MVGRETPAGSWKLEFHVFRELQQWNIPIQQEGEQLKHDYFLHNTSRGNMIRQLTGSLS